ncbi:hypothetical protein FBU59_005607 [Linderina macrospora]|uniref:Uncharacterized protein n=1 Tax=Linderina macrospora TaxID=4868 RepID=A0ACC1J2D4_9FUNG|nr:hypothetical protein FBU59_005607 [Linderina macrospora]
MSTPETEAQRRRRLRQERILNRGTDRLSRIKGTFSQVQEESDRSEMAVVGGHELPTSSADNSSRPSSRQQHVAGISLESATENPKPRRRVGNLARKAAQEEREKAESASSAAESKPVGMRTEKRPAVAVADINSDALHDSVNDTIADPGASASVDPQSALGGILVPRQLSIIGASRAFVRLLPVVSLFVYGTMRESRYDRLLGEDADATGAKWSSLLSARPDNQMAEWSTGSYLLWYLMILEVGIFSAYVFLSDRPPRVARPAIAQLPGIPDWPFVALSAGNRILESASLLLFLTAINCLVS